MITQTTVHFEQFEPLQLSTPPPLPPSPLPVSDSLSARIHRPMLALIAGNNFAKRYRRRWLRHRIDSPNRLSLSLRL